MDFKGLLLAFWIAQGADMATTVAGLNRGCVELNPFYQSRSVPAMVGIKAGATVLVTGFAWGAHKRGQSKLAKVMLWGGIISGAGAASWNLTQIHKC